MIKLPKQNLVFVTVGSPRPLPEERGENREDDRLLLVVVAGGQLEEQRDIKLTILTTLVKCRFATQVTCVSC